MFACFWPATDEPATVSPEDTISNLRSHVEQQEKRERYLELKMATMAKEAKQKLAQGDKKGTFCPLYKMRRIFRSLSLALTLFLFHHQAPWLL